MSQTGSSLNQNTISREVARAAAQWLMKLHGGELSKDEIQACDQWRQTHPDHEQAWQQATSIQAKLGLIPTETGMKILDRKMRTSRRDLLKTLTILITAAPASYIAYQTKPWQSWTADYSTNKGEQRQIDLADGSLLHLNTDTIVDIKFTDQQRLIVLRQGEILIETGKDNANFLSNPRTMVVQTDQGQLQPIGTRFMVRQMSNKPLTQLSVLEGIVEASPRTGARSKQIKAGQQVLLSKDHIDQITSIDQYADTWSKGLFYARNMRLDDFLKEISRYRKGLLRCDPAVANLRISGAFQINNTDKILSALPDTLPVVLNYLTPYWVTVRSP